MKRFVALFLAPVAALFTGLVPAHANAPAQPQQVTVQSVTENGQTIADAAVEVSWTRDASVDIYDVIATATGSPTSGPVSLVCQSSPCTAQLANLAGGVTYDFRVTARNVTNGLDSSTTVAFLTRSVPAAPTAGSATPGLGEVALSWTAPANTGGLTLTSFRITTADGQVNQTIAANQTSAVISGLNAGATYTFRIAAVNALGSSVRANFQQATVLSVPDAPSAPAATVNDSSITVTWQAPAANGGSPITEYRVQLRRNNADVGAPQIVQTGTSATFNSLPGGSYAAQVIAVNQVGASARSVQSNTVQVIGASLLPNVPVFTPANIATVEIGTAPSFSVSAAQGSVVTISVAANPAGACRFQGGVVQTLAVGTCTITAAASGTLTHQAGSSQATFQIIATSSTPPLIGGGGGGAGGGGGGGAAPAPVQLTRAMVIGTVLAGNVLGANPGTWRDQSTLRFEFQWYRCSKELVNPTLGDVSFNCSPIFGATGANYQVSLADEGRSLLVEIMAFDLTGALQGIASVYSNTLAYGATGAGAVAAPSNPGALRGWTKDFGRNQLKLYARGIIGAGKVSFRQNGREIAWVRAVDATDPKLNVGTPGARDGMVRTATPVMGRNVFEIWVDGERVARRIFTRR